MVNSEDKILIKNLWQCKNDFLPEDW